MQVKDRLPRAASVVHHRAVAFEQLAFARQLRGDQLQLAKEGLIFGRGVGQRFEMLTRANQNVRGRLRTDIFKREELWILIHDFRGDLLRGDLAEQAVGAHRFPPAGVLSSNRVTNGVKPSRSRSWSPSCRAASSPVILPTRTR